jgi:hypothetical protein
MSVRANRLSLPYLDRHLKLAKINSQGDEVRLTAFLA